MAQRPSRKLAVIVHADVVGSTALVQRNETLAHERIRDAFGRFAEEIRGYGGVVHEIRGDALVAEFARASDAVCAALRFQQSNTAYNAEIGDEGVPVVRVGIALGEEVIAHETVTGAGVVLAQRVEQFAEPGGVCVTAAIQEALPRRMPFEEESLGEPELKGIEKPVRVYRIRLKPGEAVPEAEATRAVDARSQMWRLVVVCAAGALFVAGGLLFWLKPWAPREEPASVERTAVPLPDKPSIAVLPFANLSDDRDQEYFSDGITTDLIADLSQISGLLVIARTSAFTYKGRDVNVQQVGQELGVRYVLEGSLRRANERIRITVQLADADKGVQIWAQRYDGSVEDIFALQDEVTNEIVSTLSLTLTQQERELLSKRYTADVDAYDLFLRGREEFLHYAEDSLERAGQLYRRAIALDPSFARAHGALAVVEVFSAVFGWVPDPERTIDQALALARNAVSLDDGLPETHWALGYAYLFNRQHDRAIAAAKKAIELNPNFADAYGLLAYINNFIGKPDEALRLLGEAIRLNPHYPSAVAYVLGQAYYLTGRYVEVVTVLERAAERNPTNLYQRLLLAGAYVRLDRHDDAAWELTQIEIQDAEFSLEEWAKTQPYRNPQQLHALLDDLRAIWLTE